MKKNTDNTQKSKTKSGDDAMIQDKNNQSDDANNQNVADNNQSADAQEYEMVGGVACPVDPMERLQCESCQ